MSDIISFEPQTVAGGGGGGGGGGITPVPLTLPHSGYLDLPIRDTGKSVSTAIISVGGGSLGSVRLYLLTCGGGDTRIETFSSGSTLIVLSGAQDNVTPRISSLYGSDLPIRFIPLDW